MVYPVSGNGPDKQVPVRDLIFDLETSRTSRQRKLAVMPDHRIHSQSKKLRLLRAMNPHGDFI